MDFRDCKKIMGLYEKEWVAFVSQRGKKDKKTILHFHLSLEQWVSIRLEVFLLEWKWPKTCKQFFLLK